MEIQTAEDYIPDGSSSSCDGEFIFAVKLQSSTCDPFVCWPLLKNEECLGSLKCILKETIMVIKCFVFQSIL